MKVTTQKQAFIGDWVETVFDDSPSKFMMTSNLGAEIRLKTKGARKLILNWHNNAQNDSLPQVIAVKIDDKSYTSYDLSDYDVIIDLINTDQHTIRIVVQGNAVREHGGARYWNDNEKFYFKSATVDAGTIEPNPSLNPKIIFIGDSITAGQKIDIKENGPRIHHPERNYAALVADALKFDNIRIAYGGTGITPKAAYSEPSGVEFLWSVDKNTPRPLHENEEVKFIVVNIGTNDSRASEKEFKFSLEVFLQELNKRFHDIPKIVLIPFNQQFADVFRNAVQISKVDFQLVETADWNVKYSDKLHPNDEGSKNAANKLIDFLKEENYV